MSNTHNDIRPNLIELKQKAKAHDPKAQYELGMRYMTGDEEIQKNRILGIGYLKKAAEQKHIGALRTLLSYYGDKRRKSYSPVKALLYVEELEKLGEKIDFKKKIQFRTKTTTKKGKDREKRKKDTSQRDQRHKGLSSSTREKLNNILYGFECIVAVAVLILVLVMLAKLERMLFPSLHSFGCVLVYLAMLTAIVFIVVALYRKIHEKSERKRRAEEEALWTKYVCEMEDIIEKKDSDQAKSMLFESLNSVSPAACFIRIIVFQHYGNSLYKGLFERVGEPYGNLVSEESFLGFPPLCFPFANRVCYSSDYERKLIEYIYGLGSLFRGLSGKLFDDHMYGETNTGDLAIFANDHIFNPDIPEKDYFFLNDNVFPGMNNSGKIGLLSSFKVRDSRWGRFCSIIVSDFMGQFEYLDWDSKRLDKLFYYGANYSYVEQYGISVAAKEELRANNGDSNAQYYLGVKCLFRDGCFSTDTSFWLNKAMQQGHKQAKGLINLLLELEPLYKKLYHNP